MPKANAPRIIGMEPNPIGSEKIWSTKGDMLSAKTTFFTIPQLIKVNPNLIFSAFTSIRLTSCGMNSEALTIGPATSWGKRSEEHTSELQSQFHLVCRLLL